MTSWPRSKVTVWPLHQFRSKVFISHILTLIHCFYKTTIISTGTRVQNAFRWLQMSLVLIYCCIETWAIPGENDTRRTPSCLGFARKLVYRVSWGADSICHIHGALRSKGHVVQVRSFWRSRVAGIDWRPNISQKYQMDPNNRHAVVMCLCQG